MHKTAPCARQWPSAVGAMLKTHTDHTSGAHAAEGSQYGSRQPRGWGVGVGGLAIRGHVPRYTIPRLAVTVWTWMQWMSAGPYPWIPDGTMGGRGEGAAKVDQPSPPPSYLHH